tara:strand:- start:47740 stop:48747 length:1008 start_codon:yes stop_codon:yes gene_type:complete
LSNKLIDYREHDKNFWYEELEGWVPKRIYDCHVHMLQNNLIDDSSVHKGIFPDADLEGIKAWHKTVFPNREINNLFLGRPALGTRINEYNEFLYNEIKDNPLTRAHRLTTPSDSLADIESDVKNKGFQGLKVYRMYSVTGDMANCTIEEYLPHEQLELANELGLWVTLHMSREDGCGDEKNLKDLTEFTTKRYPNIKWILAHIARSFTYRPIQQGIDTLKNLPNIFYDLSAVTDIRPYITLFSEENHERIFYGTDAVESVSFHGAYSAFGHAHQQVETDNIPSLTFSHTTNRPLICIYEQLIAMKQASIICELDKNQLEDIFWRNAVREFNVPWN